jgi:hypothetical protein
MLSSEESPTSTASQWNTFENVRFIQSANERRWERKRERLEREER